MTKQGYKESPLTDAGLLRSYQRGNPQAFEQLLRRYERPLFTFIVRIVGDRDDAEDVFQDTLRRALENIKSYKEQGKFGSWLFGIAYHLCVDRGRKKKRWKLASNNYEDLIDPIPLPDRLLEQKELKEMITQALQYLSLEQREVFLLRQHSGLVFREIAGLVNRPLSTVLSQMRLAVLSIRAFLKEKMK